MDDREIARRSLDLQAHARDYRLLDLPGYMAWSKRKLSEGESETLIAHLDAMCMCLLPEETVVVTEDDYEDLLADLKDRLSKDAE